MPEAIRNISLDNITRKLQAKEGQKSPPLRFLDAILFPCEIPENQKKPAWLMRTYAVQAADVCFCTLSTCGGRAFEDSKIVSPPSPFSLPAHFPHILPPLLCDLVDV